jgi:peroxiredoxin
MDPIVPSGSPAPDFSLKDLDGREYNLAEYRSKLVLINFWSAECPWSKRVDAALAPLRQEWGDEVVLLPIASNAGESVNLLRRVAGERGYPVVLLDPDQEVADCYGAVTTPHFFLIDRKGLLRYQGALDDTSFRQRDPTRHYLAEAVRAVNQGRSPDPAETDSYGCAIIRFAAE